MLENFIRNIWYFLKKFIIFILNVLNKNNIVFVSEKNHERIFQFVKFSVIGMSNCLVNYSTYVISICFVKYICIDCEKDFLIAQALAFLVSVYWAFYWDKKYVFNVGKVYDRFINLKILMKTYMSYAFTGLFLSEILLIFWVEFLGITKFIAPLINMVICLPLNFIINKKWTFRNYRY